MTSAGGGASIGDPRFAALPSALARQSRWVRLGPTGVPALLAHPDWTTPRPVVIWMHGRTVNKELDNGRYLRWIRAGGGAGGTGGIAACALDLPGHGERFDAARQSPARTLEVIAEMAGEIDGVLDALAGPEYGGVFDTSRCGIGGMSAGGMATLIRLTQPPPKAPHRLCAAAVESTAGNMTMLFRHDAARAMADASLLARIDPMLHIQTFMPVPLLALHSRADRVAPIECMTSFLGALAPHYARLGADPDWITLNAWDQTGAPDEHNGFGRVAAEAKSLQTAFFERWLGGVAPQGLSGEPQT